MKLHPEHLAEGYGSARGAPLLEADLTQGPAGPPGDRELWHLAGELSLAGGRVAYDQRLTQRRDGSFVLRTDGAGLHVDAGAARITLEADRESLARQLVTTYGLPLLLLDRPALVLHACAAVAPGAAGAVIVCGSSGIGKSSLLVGLVSAGWRAVSEDLCVVDMRGSAPTVWPGPPWVRRDGDGPRGSLARFRTIEKTAWDIAPWQVEVPTAIERLVFMERAGGGSTVWEPVEKAEAIARLARRTAWLGVPEDRAEATFAPSVRLAGSVPSSGLRLRVAADWVDGAVATLRAGLSDDGPELGGRIVRPPDRP